MAAMAARASDLANPNAKRACCDQVSPTEAGCAVKGPREWEPGRDLLCLAMARPYGRTGGKSVRSHTIQAALCMIRFQIDLSAH